MRNSRGIAVRWERLALGFLLATAGGVVLGHAWATRGAAWWWVGSLSLLGGILLILSGAYASRREPPQGKLSLGELVIRKGWVTEKQLADALVRQHYSDDRLGRVLVEMKLITPAQLAQALQEQMGEEEGAEENPPQ